jgi:predicted membrane channel-forming protein YqfA (hemolysin III family)
MLHRFCKNQGDVTCRPAFSATQTSITIKQNNPKRIKIMRLSEPKVVTFWIAVGLALLGLLASQGIIAGLAAYAFWLVVAGFVLLALGNLMKGL